MSLGQTLAVVARVALVRASRRTSTYAIATLTLVPALLGAVLGALHYGSVTETAGPVAIRVVGPLLVIALVAGPAGEAFESRTVLYYFTRPVPRAAVLTGEALGYAALAAGVLALAGAFLAIANALTGTADLGSLARIPLGLAGQGVALVGFCVGVAALFPKHPLVAAIGILTVTEGALAAVPGVLQYASLSYHVGQLTGLATDTADQTQAVAAVPWAASVAALAVYALVPFLLALRVVEDRDLT